jgi:predicted transcriptional regulator of viral defense system
MSTNNQKETSSKSSKSMLLIEALKKRGIMRAGDIEALGMSRESLAKMLEKGVVERLSRGLYTLSGQSHSENFSLAQVSVLIPQGVICLLSALQFHHLTTQLPFEIWTAIGNKTWPVRRPELPVRLVRFSFATLSSGIEEHIIDKVPVKIFCPAKTVADCFKFRNKIGLDVAIESLRSCLRKRLCTLDEIWHYAKICRVTNVIRPFLEAVT